MVPRVISHEFFPVKIFPPNMSFYHWSQVKFFGAATFCPLGISSMEQHTLKNVNYCLNTNIYSYLETSGGQSCNVYLNVVHFFNTSVNYMSVAAFDSCFPA
jgi:hypothetical protein